MPPTSRLAIARAPAAGLSSPGRAVLRRRSLIAAVAAAAVGGAAHAAPPAPAVAPPVHVVITGDSLAEGVWGSLFRRFYRSRALRIVNAAAASTGFNRTPYEETVRDLLGQHPIELLVMLTGANDAQDAWGLDGGPTAAFGTEEWRALYTQRIRRFLDTVRDAGLSLIWVGLPVMRNLDFEAKIAQVRSAHRDLCMAYDIPLFDMRAVTCGNDGAYTQLKRDDAGRMRLLRYEDGVHFADFGNDLIGEMLLYYVLETRPAWLTPDIEQLIQPAARS